MENAIELSVPLVVTAKVGENWYDVEEVEEVEA
jgi:DNA polymerase I-like protein with 3'-5' exonuclease and polymerase domains